MANILHVYSVDLYRASDFVRFGDISHLQKGLVLVLCGLPCLKPTGDGKLSTYYLNLTNSFWSLFLQ